MENVIAKTAKHAKEEHGFTEEQLNSSEVVEKTKAVVKQK